MDYAALAPLPCALADHLFRQFQDESLFIAAVQESRRDIFDVLDPYVRAGALTRALVIDRLGLYGKAVAQSTFTHWQRQGIIKMERSGKLRPLSAQAILIAAMIDPGQRNWRLSQAGFLPPDGVPEGDTWCCYIQRNPDADVEVWPVGRLDELPPASLCWTPLRSACWEQHWHLIGAGGGFLGCIRFAGAHRVRGQTWYDITIEDIRMWDAQVADLYVPCPGDDLEQVQVLCYPLFHRLAIQRLGTRRC